VVLELCYSVAVDKSMNLLFTARYAGPNLT